ncbi:MAG: inorganic phosphate transporter, partial [bacterium]
MEPSFIVLVILALAFDFLNGVHDSSNVVATMISSRAIPPRIALLMTAIANFVGPFIFGVAVATTIGHDIVAAEHVNLNVLLAACLSAIFWNVLTWILGIPSSSSHAIIGGLIGAVVMKAGFKVLILKGILKVLIALFASPVIGFLAGILIANLVFLISWKASPNI